MKELTKITDYDFVLDLLIQQYKDKPDCFALIQTISKQSEDLEDALFEVRDEFWVSSAVGVQLDVLGAIQNETRYAKNDTDYRTAIQTRILINNGSGEFEILITALTGLFGATTAHLQNQGNANLYLWTDIVLTEAIYNSLVEITAAGVKLWAVGGSSNPFVFYDDPDGAGFGKINDEEQLKDVSGNNIQDVSGNNILVTINESHSTAGGGELQGLWS
jgi:hypothetical protein